MKELWFLGHLIRIMAIIIMNGVLYAFTLMGETWTDDKNLLQVMEYQAKSLGVALPVAEIRC